MTFRAQNLYHTVTDSPKLSPYLNNPDALIEPWFTKGGFLYGFTLTSNGKTATFAPPLVLTETFTVEINNLDGVLPRCTNTVFTYTFENSEDFTRWLLNKLNSIKKQKKENSKPLTLGEKMRWLFDHEYLYWCESAPTITAKGYSLLTGIPLDEVERRDREDWTRTMLEDADKRIAAKERQYGIKDRFMLLYAVAMAEADK